MLRPSRLLGARFSRPFYHPQRFYPVLFGPLCGLKLRFDPQVTVRELLGFWERNNFAAIMRLRDAGFLGSAHPVMYDIGANFGLYSLLVSGLLGPQGRGFAFEPGEAPRALMIDKLQRNKIRNVLVEDLACSDRGGTAEFYISKDQNHTASLR